jgi:hypothetical protein
LLLLLVSLNLAAELTKFVGRCGAVTTQGFDLIS